MLKSTHFHVKEFLPKDIWESQGEKAAWLISPNLFGGAEALRKVFNDNWHEKGYSKIIITINDHVHNNYRGWRPFDCKIGAKNSQHKETPCQAMDFDVIKIVDGIWFTIDSRKVQEFLLRPEIWKIISPYFRRIEIGTIGWTHLDNKHVPGDRLLPVTFRP